MGREKAQLESAREMSGQRYQRQKELLAGLIQAEKTLKSQLAESEGLEEAGILEALALAEEQKQALSRERDAQYAAGKITGIFMMQSLGGGRLWNRQSRNMCG